MLRKLALALVLTAGISPAYSRVFEIRTYTTSQKMERLEALFREHSLALFKKHGFEVIGFWVPQDPPRSENTFIYMLAFHGRETAKARWDAFHNDPEWLKVRAEFVWLLAEKAEAPIWIDMCFAWTVTIACRGTGRRISPLHVDLRRPAANRRVYEDHFRCPVKFGARHNRLFFCVEDINRPFVTHNPDLLDLVSPQLEAELSHQLSGESLKEQVKSVLKKLLAGQRPRLEDVALELRVSTRTLQRRLLEERITFHGVVEEARREMAQHYLLESSLELNETAYLLGFEDPNSFIRAFHKWEGMPPGEWRSTRNQTVH